MSPGFPPADSADQLQRWSCICNLSLFDGPMLTHYHAEGLHCGFFDVDALEENYRDDKKRSAIGFHQATRR
jgi:hypothetical protein